MLDDVQKKYQREYNHQHYLAHRGKNRKRQRPKYQVPTELNFKTRKHSKCCTPGPKLKFKLKRSPLNACNHKPGPIKVLKRAENGRWKVDSRHRFESQAVKRLAELMGIAI